MKNHLFILILSLGLSPAYSQIVQSTCSASANIVSDHQDDADRITLREVYHFYPWGQSTYVDSIQIPQTYSDTIMDALIAVYNATGLPAVDTVTTMYDIHTFPDIEVDGIAITADSTLPWVQELQLGNVPTGTQFIDSLITLYGLDIEYYSTYAGMFGYHTVRFRSIGNYNIAALADEIEALPEIIYADPINTPGSGNNIEATINSDHVELIYSIGWGDCESLCINRRFWKFKVYFDCSVGYGGSYGSALPLITDVPQVEQNAVIVGPNPFTDHINIRSSGSNLQYAIFNILGEELLTGKLNTDHTVRLGGLPSGNYILRVKGHSGPFIKKLVKN